MSRIQEHLAQWRSARGDREAQCLCNALLANVGLPQPRANGGTEPSLLTSGDDLETISTFLAGRTSYTAADVISYLLGEYPV